MFLLVPVHSLRVHGARRTLAQQLRVKRQAFRVWIAKTGDPM